MDIIIFKAYIKMPFVEFWLSYWLMYNAYIAEQ